MRHDRIRPMRGFTLTELLIVVAIIGILMAFVLIAAADGVRRAEEKATLGLIAKLEMGLSERVEAILIRRADIYQAHADMGAIFTSGGVRIPITGVNQRAQVIAQIDLYRSEIPDVFIINSAATTATAGSYPINFAGLPYPYPNGSNFIPLGALAGINTTLGAYGATWQAMSGINKGLGYLPAGYDGVDNNGDTFTDDLLEGTGGNAGLLAQIQQNLSLHTHKSARSEMLYALLVNGQGPLGSIFAADEFTNREVADTDGDGLLEFIDAWGEPLQFYRWPIFYNGDYPPGGANLTPTASYIQKGILPYASTEPRQTDPLDPNQQLMAPAWFLAPGASNGSTYSTPATAFMTYFHTLIEPPMIEPPINGLPPTPNWDRSGYYTRRAYYSRPLILSSGPDKLLGVVHLSTPVTSVAALVGSGGSQGENYAGQQLLPINPANAVINADLAVNGQDDITNQGLASPGGGTR